VTIFRYSARDASGVAARGEIEAASRKAAIQRLASNGLKPISINEAGTRSERSKEAKGFLAQLGGSGKRERIDGRLALPFLTTLKELVACGVQTGDALHLLSTRLNDPSQKKLANLLWDDVRQGRSLSEACRKRGKVFDDSMVSLIEAGEATGNLNNVLGRLVQNLEETKEIRAKLFSAMAYPSFLFGVAIILVLMFLFFLLPQIEGLLYSLGGDLPFATRLLIWMADATLAYGWIAAIGFVLGIVSLLSWRKSASGRVSFDALILRLPQIGLFLKDVQVQRLTQVLSLLLENGITMVQALQMTERSLTNHAMREKFIHARGKVTEGASLSSAFKSTGYFDGMALDIFTVGENTGNIVPGLKQLTRQYTDRVDKAIKAFIGLVSVGVLFFVFAFVALVAYGMISAVFQLSGSLST